MSLRYYDDPGYSLGMIRDEASWQLPKGALYDAQNVIFDQAGILRQRGGTTAVGSTASAFCTSLGWAYSADATPIEELYGIDGRSGTAYSINKTTGAATSIGTPVPANSIVGRPVRHFGFLIFPAGSASCAIVAGQTSSTTFTASAAATISAGNPQITLTGADVTTNVKVGAYVLGTAGTAAYAGRVVSVDTSKLFSVWPVPTLSFNTTSLTTLPTNASANRNGGVCTTSFQNRLLFGNPFDLQASASAGTTSRADRRVNYSLLPTETTTVGGVSITGAAGMLFAPYWPTGNWFDSPAADPIVALEPIDDGQLLILTTTHPVIFRGDLVTQTNTNNTAVTFDEKDILRPAGCLSDLSVQRTPMGVVWAGAGGVYVYNGGSEVGDLTRGRINSYWRALLLGSTPTIHGSAYVRGQYIVSGSSGGSTFSVACDMNSSDPRWTRLSGAGTDIFLGAARPMAPNQGQVFAARWWSQGSAAPSMTGGQIVRLETIGDAYAGGSRADSDGAAIPVSVTTRVLGGDTETQKLFQRLTVRYQQSSTTAAMAVTAQSKIDAADISSASVRSLGSLSNTSVLTVTLATNASPIRVTTSTNHGLQSDDYVDIDGATGNTAANGRYRITVASSTTFDLNGSTGNGALGGSPTCKKLTESGFLASSLNSGQGASLTISGSPNNFELHGVRIAALEKPPVMVA